MMVEKDISGVRFSYTPIYPECFSRKANVFHKMTLNVKLSAPHSVFYGRMPPEPGTIVGYGAIIHSLALYVPLPDTVALISNKNRKYRQKGWQVFGPRYQPGDSLYRHLIFALRYEGIRLLCLKKLFENLSPQQVVALVQTEPHGLYCRKLWFLYEWLLNKKLPLPDAEVKISYKPLLNQNLQYGISGGARSPRHRIINNLPGTRDFCPLIFRTEKLDNYHRQNLSQQENQLLSNYAKGLLQRAASFLLLQDSRASFTIEGENPQGNRAARWSRIIGQAGMHPLNREELLRLQKSVIEDQRFVKIGFRREGGFIGEHDRDIGIPIPEHISAKWQDLERLVNGLVETCRKVEESDIDAVMAAAAVAFGFVFIHPFQDGNGRIHRYLIHHILARKGFSRQELVFPVSAAILEHINDYRRILQHFSQPLLDLIDWEVTADNNVKVINDTIDYYRYFDATLQAEFLYDMVQYTLDNMIPAEINYLSHYDRFKHFIKDRFDMPDKTISLLLRFLEQHNGTLSKRAREKEFAALSDEEIREIESQYRMIFTG